MLRAKIEIDNDTDDDEVSHTIRTQPRFSFLINVDRHDDLVCRANVFYSCWQ